MIKPLKDNYFIKIIIFINIITTIIIYLDFYIPREHKTEEQFQSFESKSTKEYGKYGKSTYYTLYYILCENKNSYQIKELPDFYNEFKKGQKIIIFRTYFLNKIKEIQLTQNGITYIQDLSFLNVLWIKISFLIVLLISFVSLFYSNKIFDILLSFCFVFILYTLLNYFNFSL